MTNFTVMGIASTVQNARLNPKGTVSITAPELAGQSNGRLFVAIKDLDPTVPNALSLLFNDKPVCIKSNETYIQTNTEDQPLTGFKVYPFDIPMRFIENQPRPTTYSIQFILGSITNETFTETGRSDIYTLTITSDELPKFDPTTD